MRVGLIARMDRTGLGQGQTLRLAAMLKPQALMLINSQPFNRNQQFPEWYTNYNKMIIHGFPTTGEIRIFLNMVDVVVTCETFYNNEFTSIAKEMGKKTILIANYEFFDWFRPEFARVPLPDKIVIPSKWHIDEMYQKYNAKYIPTPLFTDEFEGVAQFNMARTGKRRYLFINGRQAIHDRNGLTSLYDALKYSKGDFEIVVRAQGEIPLTDDPRVIYDLVDEPVQSRLYRDFDALIMPRRYAGQCLPMTEALMCGLPVVMTDIDPNNKVLPPEWLVPAHHMGTFITRTPIDLYSADTKALADKLDNLDVSHTAKESACFLAGQFVADNLKEEYREMVELWK